jgi:glycerophosphoryl diester phosphodiesterase
MTGSIAPRSGPAAAISAHSGGSEVAPAATYEAYQAALAAGVEYVELDVRRTADGQLVVFHDASASGGEAVADMDYSRLCELAGYQVPRAAAVMRLIAGTAIGHLDVKEAGGEDAIIEEAVQILGPAGFVATGRDTTVAAIRSRFPGVQVALSAGGDLTGLPWRIRATWRRREQYPLNRIRACGAGWAALHYRLALAGGLQQCHLHGIRTMVWTVNGDAKLIRLLADPRVDVVVTDRPRHAMALRAQLLSAGGSR